MRQLLASTLIMAFVAGSATAQQATPVADTRPGVAVLPFFNGGSYGEKKDDLTLLQVGLQQTLINELSVNTNMRLVDRSVLKELMAEQDLGASGRVDPQTAARIGKLVGARYVVLGSFLDWTGNGGDFQLTARIVDGETGEIMKSARVEGQKKKLFSLLVDMATDVTKGVKLPELSAEVREARKSKPVTPEGLARYSLILSYKDDGETQKAIELYKELIRDFPQMEEWKAELRQLTNG